METAAKRSVSDVIKAVEWEGGGAGVGVGGGGEGARISKCWA